jgi:hypothetical protein
MQKITDITVRIMAVPSIMVVSVQKINGIRGAVLRVDEITCCVADIIADSYVTMVYEITDYEMCGPYPVEGRSDIAP